MNYRWNILTPNKNSPKLNKNRKIIDKRFFIKNTIKDVQILTKISLSLGRKILSDSQKVSLSYMCFSIILIILWYYFSDFKTTEKRRDCHIIRAWWLLSLFVISTTNIPVTFNGIKKRQCFWWGNGKCRHKPLKWRNNIFFSQSKNAHSWNQLPEFIIRHSFFTRFPPCRHNIPTCGHHIPQWTPSSPLWTPYFPTVKTIFPTPRGH